jgi:multimeric flavodoxin WrbA
VDTWYGDHRGFAIEKQKEEKAMDRALAINGSPRMEKGNTAALLAPFVQGMIDAGADVEVLYASRLKIRPCTCGRMYCWYTKPGECCIRDDMQLLYPKLTEADILILATPVYIPLPGAMQNLVNRLCPLLKPLLEARAGRTRARFHENVQIQKIVLVSTGAWWEKANFDTVMRIVREIAEDAGVEYAGAVLRPHAFAMNRGGELTAEGKAVLEAARKAGHELVYKGAMDGDTLEAISRPLMSHEELVRVYNESLSGI